MNFVEIFKVVLSIYHFRCFKIHTWAPRLGGVKQKKSSWGLATNNKFLLFHSSKPRGQVPKMVYSKSFQTGRIQPKNIVKRFTSDCIYRNADLNLYWLWQRLFHFSNNRFIYWGYALPGLTVSLENPPTSFWATHFNRKWGHFPFHMLGRLICILIETICPNIWPKPPPQKAKSLLSVDVRRFKLPIFDPFSQVVEKWWQVISSLLVFVVGQTIVLVDQSRFLANWPRTPPLSQH